jgi:thioredoxin 1
MNPLLPAVIAIVIPAASVLAMPPIFTKKNFEDAKKQAAAEGKLLVVDSMADWCPPCKQMDKTTWVDEKTIAYFKDNAIAFQFDVDKEEKLAKDLKIEAMPTMIVFKDGKEIDRSVGFMSTSEMIGWLEDVKKGKTKAAALAEEAKKLRENAGNRVGEDGKVDIRERMDIARKLSRSDPDLAAQEYAWLWDNMLKHDQAYYGVRLSFLIGDMQQLAQRHEGARAEFVKLRDAAEAKLKDKTATRDTLVDWIKLNEVVDDDDRTLAWYDRVKDDSAASRDIKRNERDLRRIFEEKKRWADMGRMYKNPERDARGQIQQNQMMEKMAPAEHAAEMKKYAQREVMSSLSTMHAALLAAGREEEAGAVAGILLEYSDTPESRRALVSRALEAGQARASHRALLEADKDSGNQDLRRQLEAALKGR